MSELKVNKVSPRSGTDVTLGDSGDTFTVPTGASLVATDELKTNKISPSSGTAFTFGDSGDTFTIPAGATITNSGTATGFGGGKVAQVVSKTKTDGFSTSSTSTTEVLGLAVSITPSATSSKVLILVDGNVSESSTTAGGAMKLFRDTTEICKGTNGSASNIGFDNMRRNSGSDESKKFAMNFLDSPSSTSTLTYKISVKAEGGTWYINRTGSSDNNSLVSTITAMEILN
tara:strand:+ start:345 stop:1034 length:690 start_codon:yes stop_codon:yes gene_type:complete